MTDKDSQFDEILALKSIYEEDNLLQFDDVTNKGTFYAKVNNQGHNFNIKFVIENEALTVEHLPPLVLNFEYPSDYPSVNPPKFTLACKWLSLVDVVKLCKKLDELWERDLGCPILFTWISFLMEESLDFLNISNGEISINTKEKNESKDKDSRANTEPCSVHLISDYDKDESERIFHKSYYTCNVCFTDKIGSECMQFHKCNHVFCNECMKGYFEVQIKDGNVNQLKCPYDKCETQALPTQVYKIVDNELYKRYDYLLLKNSLNSMSDIIYCPRPNCQTPVLTEANSNAASCTKCHYVFCALCRQSFHGIEPCKLKHSEMKRICEAYKNGSKEERDALTKQYGPYRIQKAIEEYMSMSLIEDTSKQCPKCKSWMQKLDGCNKMTCVKCQTYFCWLCLGILSKADPYSHFNSKTSNCFERLFEGIDQNDNNQRDEERFEFINEDDNETGDSDFEINENEEDDDFIIQFLV